MQHPNSNHAHRSNLHSTHDVALIAGHAAGDLVDSERARAQALLGTCEPCAELHADLVAIAGATKALPNLARAPRDFRLDAAQAARLRRGSWLRGLLRPFGASGSAVRPFAAAFTSAGVAGLLVAAVLPGLLGGAASAPERDALTSNGSGAAASAAAAPAATAAPPALVPAAGAPGPTAYVTVDRTNVQAASTDPGENFGAEDNASHGTAKPLAAAGAPGSPKAEGVTSDTTGRLTSTAAPNPIIIGSLALLGVGLGLFGLRLAGRRLR